MVPIDGWPKSTRGQACEPYEQWLQLLSSPCPHPSLSLLTSLGGAQTLRWEGTATAPSSPSRWTVSQTSTCWSGAANGCRRGSRAAQGSTARLSSSLAMARSRMPSRPCCTRLRHLQGRSSPSSAVHRGSPICAVAIHTRCTRRTRVAEIRAACCMLSRDAGMAWRLQAAPCLSSFLPPSPFVLGGQDAARRDAHRQPEPRVTRAPPRLNIKRSYT